MVELTEQQIDLISAYIKQNGIAQNELHEDLLDHVCTSIERLMVDGETFETAFDKTLKLFGPGGLKQVQQQTFELLTEMNATMKKVTFAFGLTSTILLLAGTIFKLMHWPGAGIMVVLGAGLLSLVYLPLVLAHKLKESPSNERVLHIAGFIGLSLTVIGALFKIMHWPGAGVMLVGGMAYLGFIYIPIYFYKKYKSSANKPITLSMGLVAMTCLILVFALTRVNNSLHYDHGVGLVGEQLSESVERADVSKLYHHVDGQRADDLSKMAEETVSFIEDLKIELISATEGISLEDAKTAKIYMLEKKTDHNQPTDILFDPEGKRGVVAMDELIKKLDQFEKHVIGYYPQDMQADIGRLVDLQTDKSYDYHGNTLSWSEYHFYNVPLLSVVAQLTKIQADIRQAELQTLSFLVGQSAASNPPS